MRIIILLLLLLVGLGFLVAELPSAAGTPRSDVDQGWRRTGEGWQRPVWLVPGAPVRPPTLHPLVVGLFQLFLAMGLLVAFSGVADRRPQLKRRRKAGKGAVLSSTRTPYRFLSADQRPRLKRVR